MSKLCFYPISYSIYTGFADAIDRLLKYVLLSEPESTVLHLSTVGFSCLESIYSKSYKVYFLNDIMYTFYTL
jgi:hypothetical protein